MDPQTRSLDRYEPSRSNKHPSPSSSSSQHYSNRHPVVRRSSGVITSQQSGNSTLRDQSNETSISVLVWHAASSSSSSSSSSSGGHAGHSALSKAPLLRDVPQVKRKLTSRRDRDSMAASMVYDSPGNTITSSPSLTDPRSFANIINATPSWLREKPSRAKLTTGLSQKSGSWRKATLTIRDTGVLLILGEDRAMLHSISTSDLLMNDIRLVDDSLFGRPYVLGIFARPSTLTATTRSQHFGVKTAQTSSTGSASNRQKDEPIYICFPNSRKLYCWRSIFRVFARAEVYGPANAVKPVATHRCYRQVDMTVHEMRLTTDRSLTSGGERVHRTGGFVSPAPAGDGDEGASATTSAIHYGQATDGQQNNNLRRTSMEVSTKAISTVMERLNLGAPMATTNSSTESALLKHQDDPDDSKSITSTDSVAGAPFSTNNNVEGPQVAMSTSAPVASIAPEMDRRPSDGSVHNAQSSSQPNLQPSSACCQIYMDGEVIGRTRICSGTSSIAWYDKCSFRDLPFIGSMHVEVLQAWRPGKFVILGYVDLPVETMRRGETVEGWYPIWALPRLEDAWSRRDERSASYTREVVGELKLALNVFDETVLEAAKYADVKETLNADGCVTLIKRLCKELEETQVISLLVDVYTADGTIVERLSDLTRAESVNFAAEPALLFRGNSLLSRALDKYQRRYCLDWLESCVGPTVRKICTEKIKIEQGEASPIIVPALSSSSAGAMGVSASSGYDDASLETLRTLSQTLWHNIYANRHKCPPDLRRALSVIRRTVNQHFNSLHGPGVQGVGAFVFLRLVCPAITSPNLYGLMATAPEQSSVKTLMLLAKVFLALANKRQGFDKDKEPWLVKMNDFLQQHSSAYDDFITIVSSEPDDSSHFEAWGDERDQAFQRLIRQRVERLPTLHREAIARSGLRLDAAQSMSSLVSYVVRGASTEPFADNNGHVNSIDMPTNHAAKATATDEASLVNDFVDMCCDIEDLVGYHLDRAGYDPEPLSSVSREAMSGIYRTTSVFTANKASPSMASVVSTTARATSPTMRSMLSPDPAQHLQSSPSSMQRSESANSVRARRATVSATSAGAGGATTKAEERPVFEPKMSYIGADSFLRGQLPDQKLQRDTSGDGAGAAAHVSEQDKNGDGKGEGTSKAPSNVRRPSTVENVIDGGNGHRRQSANLGRQVSHTLRPVTHNGATPTTADRPTNEAESEEEKKRRAWWRRKK